MRCVYLLCCTLRALFFEKYKKHLVTRKLNNCPIGAILEVHPNKILTDKHKTCVMQNWHEYLYSLKEELAKLFHLSLFEI